jgi:thiamine-monophosphate kinase
MKLKKLDEDSLIAEIIRDFSRDNTGLEGGIGDDAAVIRLGRERKLLTKDLLIEGVHFIRKLHPPELLGRKSLAVNISDIAAMGGRPEYVLLGLAIPSDLPAEWINGFFSGFRSCAKDCKISLIGGDITRSRDIVISVTVTGHAYDAIRRSGASPGDWIYVSGTLGDASMGLQLLQSGESPDEHPRKLKLYRAFLDPKPRVELGIYLAQNHLASAMMDLSDGISKDLPRLCRMSKAGAEIWEEELPVSDALREHSSQPIYHVLHGGEDYELIFTVPTEKMNAVSDIEDKFNLSRVGRITKLKDIILVKSDGGKTSLKPEGFVHFRPRRSGQ